MERKRRQDIEEVRKVNNNNYRNLLSKSMEIDAYHLQKSYREDMNNYHEQ